jgi:hypothetical protein
MAMGSMNCGLWLGNVKTFRDYAVIGGVVQLSDDELIKHLDNTFAEVAICNFNVKPGSVLQQIAPLMFRSAKNDYQEELQTTLQAQMMQGNDVDIEFHS